MKKIKLLVLLILLCFVSFVHAEDNTEKSTVLYKSHIQNIGWESSFHKDGKISGTTGQSKRIEAVSIKLYNQKFFGSIEYQSHIENIGWEKIWHKNGEVSGTTGQSKRLEAIKIKLTEEMAEHYDIYYRVHVENFGWLGWAKNGEEAGSSGYGYRLEAYQIMLVEKGESEPKSDVLAYKSPNIIIQSHVQNIGWQNNIYDNEIGGTVGKSKRLEAIRIRLNNQKYSGSIEYQSHIQNIGWESNWHRNGGLSGTTGQSKRLEAIKIKLTEEMAEHYDIYYRVHVENFGWLGWAKNGEEAGSAGYGYRLEAYQIKIVKKGDDAPFSTVDAYKENRWKVVNGKTYYTLSNGKLATGVQKINGSRYYFDSSGVLKYSNIKVFIDVSKWQGNIDWDTLWNSKEIDGVILRIGYSNEEDPMFSTYISEIKRLGIPYTVYLRSYAHDKNDALIEAKNMMNLFTKYQLDPALSIYYDVEGYNDSKGNSDDITKSEFQNIVETFINHMNLNGIDVKVYSYYWFALNRFNAKTRSYLNWIAKYSDTNDYPYPWRGWQYTNKSSLPGISGNVDMDIFLY